MLITSLPNPEALFLARQPPLSRLKLDRRLRALTPQHAATLKQIEQVLGWYQLPISADEEDIVQRARRMLDTIDDAVLRRVIRDRLELRSAVAALRRRAHGGQAPAPGTHWVVGRWVRHMARHWNEPDFHLGTVFDWIREADQLMRRGDALALERLLLNVSYRQLQRAADTHCFDFTAVVIYVLKWDIINRATCHNREAAKRRFAKMTQAGLGDYANLTMPS